MYSRNYLSTDNYPILPPGYSGVALQRYAHNAPEGANPDGSDSLPRRPVFEDAADIDGIDDMTSDESDRRSGKENDSADSERPDRNEEKESTGNKKIPAVIPDEQSVGKSSHDDILIAGIIMLLLSEGKCDELTLFLLGFLLL